MQCQRGKLQESGAAFDRVYLTAGCIVPQQTFMAEPGACHVARSQQRSFSVLKVIASTLFKYSRIVSRVQEWTAERRQRCSPYEEIVSKLRPTKPSCSLLNSSNWSAAETCKYIISTCFCTRRLFDVVVCACVCARPCVCVLVCVYECMYMCVCVCVCVYRYEDY
jgi:hypothetical protein